MSLDADEVVIAGTGRIYVAPVGTVGPAGVDDAPGVGWVDLGYTSTDGVTLTPNREVMSVEAWQSMYPIAKRVTSRGQSMTAQFLQWNKETFLLAFDGGEWSTLTGVHTYTPADTEDVYYRALVVDFADGARQYRQHWPRCFVGEVGDIVLSRTEESPIEITFELVQADGVQTWSMVTNDPAMATP